MINRLAAVARSLPWPALLGGALGCGAVTALLAHQLSWPVLARWPGLGALALCIGAAFVLDDAAGAITGATPCPLARRRLQRVALALPLLAFAWAGSLWYTGSADPAWSGTTAQLGLTLQVGAMLALTLAGSAVALRAMPGERGGWTGVLALFALAGLTRALPERWTLLAQTGDPAWAAAQFRWAALLAFGLLMLVAACRDAASGSAYRVRTPSGYGA